MPLEEEPFWNDCLAALRQRVESTPAHLLREEDIRCCLRDVLVAHDERYCDIENYLPEADRVDVRLRSLYARALVYYVELKLWHATLKRGKKPGSMTCGSGDETGSHLRDVLKLLEAAGSANATQDEEFYFVSLTQSCEHPQVRASRLSARNAGPFSATVAGDCNREAQQALMCMMEHPRGEWRLVQVPAFSHPAGRKKATPYPARQLELRVAAKAAWRSGGGDDWGCTMDFHVWQVRPSRRDSST